ncbi:hypothetical protein DFH06DRAFT_1468043 [Mycena polygramma]|nr:hypothetical protein DFH06DRAFT_1468043 [Mycena polygramma]
MNTLLHSVSLALFAVAAAATPVEQRDATPFSTPCSGLGLVGTILSANCKNSASVAVPTKIDLNTCLANFNARLVNGTGFDSTCSDISLNVATVTLSATCTVIGTQTSHQFSSVDLDSVLFLSDNGNGTLSCLNQSF